MKEDLLKTVDAEVKYNQRGFVYDEIMKECAVYEMDEQIRYLKYALNKWNTERPGLDPNGTLIPPFSERLKREIEYREEEIKKRESEKQLWTGTKGEFAEFVCNEYSANQKKYNSLRDASNELFDKHRFKWNDWTKEQCYDYVKKK